MGKNKKFSQGSLWLIAAIAMFSLVGCKGNLLEGYVDQIVKLNPVESTQNGVVLAGDIKFRNTHYFTDYRYVCDTVQCGYEEVCSPITRTVCHGTRTVYVDVPDSICKTDKDGKETCTPTTRREAQSVPNCHEVPDTVCRTIPRYCQENCRNEPFTNSRTTETKSSVNIIVKRTDGGVINKKQIEKLELGLKTTHKYVSSFEDVRKQTKELRPLMDVLRKEHATLVALKAKGLKLVSDQSLLNLPASFRRGDALQVELLVDAVGNSSEKTEKQKAIVSVVGSEEDVPELHTTTSEQ